MANSNWLTASAHAARIIVISAGTFGGILVASAQEASVPGPSEDLLNAFSNLDTAWTNAGLAFSVATFSDGTGNGYGQYTVRGSSEFSDTEALSVYAEPVGYSFAETDAGYEYSLTASYKLLNASGQVLAEQDGFAEFKGEGRSKQRELSAALTFQFTGLPSGAYSIDISFADKVGGDQASFALPFSVTAAN